MATGTVSGEMQMVETPSEKDAMVLASRELAQAAMQVKAEVQDTTPFHTSKTGLQTTDDKRNTADLKDPENITTDVYYDETTGTYRLGTKLGEEWLDTPYFMTEKEAQDWLIRKSMREYFRKKNKEDFEAKGKEKFDFTDMHFDLGPMNKVFGPGGVRIKTQGSAEVKFGGNHRFTDNPSLSERNRSVFGIDFDEKINVSLNGKVGDKVNMDFNYNSNATFSFDAQKLKLHYEGKEDEIIKLIEAGNVSMPTNSSLIRGASSLFGFRADMQFGKLKLQTVVAQKKSAAQSVSSKGGIQLTPFEFSADAYDENRHFYLAHYFRDHYDEAMAQLPNIVSGITINRVEVWVTNKNGTANNNRNIIALTDLGEYDHMHSKLWRHGTDKLPSNNSNSEYAELTQLIPEARDITMTTSVLDDYGLIGGEDYEKLEQARLLSSSEYRLNTTLGYISLKSSLQPDQVLAVAFEYTYRGQTYQVGEFSTDRKDNKQALLVKSLKNTANTPIQGNWHLMMKNVYSLGATSVKAEKFKLDIKYLSDTTGVYLSYIPEQRVKDKKILSLMGLDRLDNNNKPNPNGYFDFVEGYTIESSSGRVFFPVAEPFGANLRKQLGDDALADKYCYQELYDSTRTIARQIAEKNKYIITGEYKATKNDEIQIGSMNIPQGSVVVTAGGVTLVEGSDYTVDYNSGIVKILNKSILDAGTNINVTTESNDNYGMIQRKTMLGLAFQYEFSKDFQIGGTVMHLGEKPLTTKVTMGDEPLNNTLWGFNFAWKKQSQRLTDWLDALPLIEVSAPSSINLTGEFAHLIAGKVRGAQANASYIDDFENTKSEIDVSNPSEWVISSTPSMFAESKLSNDIHYGFNRALLSWFYIDPLFTRRSSSLTPGHIKADLKQLSDPDVREVYKSELFPNKQINYQEANTLSVLNLAYYPNERGPYNLDPTIDQDGHLLNPKKRWGGMMRKLETSDFESANIEYIEFWLMDPFIKSRRDGTQPVTGELYFNLGEISEDILKDGKKFYESGMPTDGDSSQYTETVWGRVPTQNSITYAFNTSSGSRSRQDVGYNGLSSTEELDFDAYKTYIKQIENVVRPEVLDSIKASPSADRYHYFRGSDYDEIQASILRRYKYINNPNGNSVATDESPESYSTAYRTQPDVEDINQDYTLNEYEKYYQYRVSISPEDLQVGRNYIVDHRVTHPKTRNDEILETDWYLFRIPVKQYERKEGNISDFSSIRFMRIFMTGFEKPTVLRMGTLNLVRGEWRGYEQSLYVGHAPENSGTLEVSAVNFEENNTKTPVNYVLPPGVSRVIDPGQQQILQNNEQALALTLKNIAPGDARAVYKNTTLDLRRYKHLQLFVHANALPEDNDLQDNQMSLFLRLGSDYKSNFYEYEIPLTVTQEGQYAGPSGQIAVWPEENMLDIDLSLLTDIKRNRNREKSLGLLGFTDLYSEYDPKRPANKVSVMGNPSLGEVRTIMIGVRNNSRSNKSVEVWANELRLQEFTNNGGWAARGGLNIQLSDLATVNATAHVETEGFGGLEETVSQRRDDNLYEYSVTTNVEAGRLLPAKVKLTAPIYYSYSKQRTSPKYNPLDTDMSMEDALDGLTTKAEKDSLRNIAEKVVVNKNFSLTGLRFNRVTKRSPLPIDLANFTVGYSHSSRHTTGETTAWERDEQWKLNFSYNYSPNVKPFEPFKKVIKSKSKWFKLPKEFGLNWLPQNIAFNSDITRSYYELQERDMQQLATSNSIPLTFSSDFLWNRHFTIRWDLTKTLHASFSSGTNAEIEQPYVAVNKALFPDEYTIWKDSVKRSLLQFGRPLTYAQQFDLSWNVPINKIPLFDWITLDGKYQANYNWNRGAELSGKISTGHTISNQRNASANAKINFETLYNHWDFLKEVNKKFSSTGKNSRPNAASKAGRGKDSKDEEKKKYFDKEIKLLPDTSQIITHNQKTKKVKVSAINKDGKRYPIQFKVIDMNKIEILSRDTVSLKLVVAPKPGPEEKTWYKTLQYATRALMLVRNVSISYRNNQNMSVPGFLPQIGDAFGQTRMSGLMSPGLDFAFGLVGEGYIRRAVQNGWLLQSDSIITPATIARTEDLQIRATLEPIRDLKIDVNLSRNATNNNSIQYMFDGMPQTRTGSFSMTILSLGSAFSSGGNADNGYMSPTFTKFVGLLDTYRSRVEARYAGSVYPAGFGALSGKPFDPANGAVDRYSADVMIPAFLEAYTSGGGALDIFPAIQRILPNWSVNYAGLAKLNAMKSIFKAFNITHAYKSIYSIGSYSTFTTYREYMSGIGFVNDVATGNPLPSSMYDISTVSINESFSPLIGVDMTFLNGITAKVEVRRTRVLTLSMTSQQLTETRSNDFVVGCGYKIADFKLFSARSRVHRAAKGKNTGDDEDSAQKTKDTNNASTATKGFPHSLNLRLDISFRNQSAITRDIASLLSQATSGNQALQLSFNADYALSKYLTLSIFYDRQMNKPLLTASSYPVTTQDFGVNLKIMLNR